MTAIRAYPGDPGITYTGAVVGRSSSRAPGKTRWSTVLLFDTGATYIAEIAGESVVPGDDTRHTLLICPTADSLVAGLQRRLGGVSRPIASYVREALEQAAAGDEALQGALRSHDEAASWRG